MFAYNPNTEELRVAEDQDPARTAERAVLIQSIKPVIFTLAPEENPWTYLSGYDWGDDLEPDWLPGHA